MQIKGFLLLNELRLKLQKEKGNLKAKEFIFRLRYKVTKNKNMNA